MRVFVFLLNELQDGDEVTKSKFKRRRKSSDKWRSKSESRKRKADRSESDLEKEDGELSDEEEDSDSYDDHGTYQNRSNIRDHRKNSIIEIDDDSNSSSETTRESYSGES